MLCFHLAVSSVCRQLTVIAWCLMSYTVVARAQVCTDSCGCEHGNLFGIMHDNACAPAHANSWRTNACGNSRVERGHDGRGGMMKLSSTSFSGPSLASCLGEVRSCAAGVRKVARRGVRRSPSELQPKDFPRSGDIVHGVLSQCLTYHLLSLLLRHLGQAGKLGVGLGGHDMGKQQGLGFGFSVVLCRESGSSLLSLQLGTG